MSDKNIFCNYEGATGSGKKAKKEGAVDHPTAPLHINHKMTCDTCTCGRS